jgi:ligand-binding sensor domain-containing protein
MIGKIFFEFIYIDFSKKSKEKIILLFLLLLFTILESSKSQQIVQKNFLFKPSVSRIASNEIATILIDKNRIWFGTNKGLSFTDDDGLNFYNYAYKDGMGKGSVSSIGIKDNVIWVATAFDTTVSVGMVDVGGGLSYSTDNGQKWNWIPQPVDAFDDTSNGKKPTTTSVQNVTYDIAFTKDEIWIASWGGGLRKSSDLGKTWQTVTPDKFAFNVLNNLNHRAFSVISARNGLWVGTAGGINKSTDGGGNWTNYTAQNESGISGDFVVAIGEQVVQNKSIIWAATWKAEGENEFDAVSKTENGGLSWEVTLIGEQAHNFEFNGNEVYVATDKGLYKSVDFGKTWAVFPQIKDETGLEILTSEIYSIGIKGEDLWVGTNDGLAKTSNKGISWKIFRAFKSTETNGEPATYAYPNPFSPSRHNVYENEGYVRIQYNTKNDTRITVKIFDFGMNLVRTLVEYKPRPGGGDYYEVWDGRNDNGVIVANGVYFYKLKRDGEKDAWGKIVVLN